ncbi:MAG TPA: Zn-ribbon domain-containing OB-fold protein [Mycobacteriales bacterium]|nr:Zn-ribbon domain-containing OB-fold protein [Mycobacteriales bacterium]
MTTPPEDPSTAPWWDATREQRLVLQSCAACAAVQHPPTPICRSCSGSDLGWVDASGTGTVDAWTTVHRSPGPGFEPPYVVARVRLAEGPLLLTNVEGQSVRLGQLRCGDPVHVSWKALPDGRHLPLFAPTEE